MTASLSRREADVLRLLAKGRLQKQVAQDLGVSFPSVRTYIDRIRKKNDGKTMAEIFVQYGRSQAGGDS